MITIVLEGNFDFAGFDCRGVETGLCNGCRLRFQCLSERDEIEIPAKLVEQHSINDLKSLVAFMFCEGKIRIEETKAQGQIRLRIVNG